ncbi:Multidrug resistance protein MdtC [BD1-7 clade bacterium]|uniref:Multidrug resistance protein MdtC n=1 Tax=BD1-7 clade bacterium TaxID=2029982 RepID=A0A5S9QAS2_9GAMM|nr:Multidrug resistance protein MdtC [BD1-7 clade bacterium]
MNRLIGWFAENPVAANLLMIAIMIGGALSIPQIDKEFFPKASLNVVLITAPYPGAAPINVEQQVCVRLEQAIEDLNGIDKIKSVARQNVCSVEVEAEDDYDVQTLLNDVKVRVDAIDTLPDDADRPQVSQIIPTHDMMSIALEGDVPEQVLKRYGETLRREMEQLPHVSRVDINGVRDYEISIELTSDTLTKYQLTLSEVQQAIQESSLDLPTGTIKSPQGDITLQARNQAYYADDFARIIVRKTASGATLRLGDIATIRDGFTEDPIIARFNGKPSLFLQVKVTSNPDVLKTNQAVMAYLDERNRTLPEALELEVWHDFSISFKDRIRTLVNNGVGGLILVFIVLMLFLRPLLALWVSIGIGIAFLGALWLMPLFGASLNMISLFAFLLILGIVVDDAIIVGESIYSEQQKHGNGVQSAKTGASMVSKPIVFAVASTMLVFVPMLFLPGKSAEAATMIPIVVLLSLAFSLIESLFVLPSHLAEMPPEGHFKNPISRGIDKLRKFFSNALDVFIHRYYDPVITRALKHTGPTIAIFVAGFAIIVSVFVGGWMQVGFFPNVTTDYIQVTIDIPDGEPLSFQNDVATRVESASKAMQQEILFDGTDVSYVKNFSVWLSGNEIRGAIGLNREYTNTLSSPELIEIWREKIGAIPQAEDINFFYQIDSKGKPLQYILSGKDNAELTLASQMLQEHLAGFPGVFEITDSLQTPRSEIELGLKPSSEFTAWDMQLLATQLRQAFYGAEVQRVPRDGEDIKVMLRLIEDERTHVDSIASLPVQDREGNTIRLDAISNITYTPALQDIERIDGQRTVTVSAELLKGTTDSTEITNDILEDFVPLLAKKHPTVKFQLEGDEEERREFMSAWGILFVQAIIAIYAMMAIAFRSYWQPIIILTAIPFGAMGAILGHLIMGMEISIFSFLGVMACAGVVVNDNLVLIDRINYLRDHGMTKLNAIHSAGIDRFRPIILTSATTFIGLIPIMSETSLQAQFLIPMVVSLAYGVLFATTVTLILVPALYLFGEQFNDGVSHLAYKLRLRRKP